MPSLDPRSAEEQLRDAQGDSLWAAAQQAVVIDEELRESPVIQRLVAKIEEEHTLFYNEMLQAVGEEQEDQEKRKVCHFHILVRNGMIALLNQIQAENREAVSRAQVNLHERQTEYVD